MDILHIVEYLARAGTGPVWAAIAPACPVAGFPCPSSTGDSIVYLSRIAGGIAGSVLGIITAMLIFYSLKLAISGQEESNVTEVRNAYLHVIFGAVLIAGAGFIASTVPATSIIAQPGSMIINVLTPMRDFFFTMVAAALTINIGYHGAKLITVQDDSGAATARQGILRGVAGLAVVLMAGAAVKAFGFNDITGLFIGLNITFATNELLGIGRFFMTLLGVMAVVCMVTAGFFLVMATDQQLQDRAKKIVITTGVAVVVATASYAIISVFF